MAKLPAGVVKKIGNGFAEGQRKLFKEREEYIGHKRVIEDAMAKRLYGPEPFDRSVLSALEALKRLKNPQRVPIRDQTGVGGPPVFPVKPGINVLIPPYDFIQTVALGSQEPAALAFSGTGTFIVNGAASAGTGFSGAAGVFLFVVPSDPGRTLSIRPYFQYEYTWSCASHGAPTAHCHGSLFVDAAGITGGTPSAFPTKSVQLFSGSSDAWNDGSGDDGGTFRIPDSEQIVSGADYYTVEFSCGADGDSGSNIFGWSETYVTLDCRVPFLVVEEF